MTRNMEFEGDSRSMEGTIKSLTYKNGNYNLEHLVAAKEDIKKGVSYTRAVKNRDISRTTLHTHIHNDYEDGCRPKQGRKYKLQAEHELKLIQYSNYCWDNGIPRTQKMLKPDIALYMEEHGIENTFKHGEPGDGWFQNLKKNHAEIRIASPWQAKDLKSMRYSEKDWVAERSQFIKQYSGESVMPSLKHIFLIEIARITDARHPNIGFDVMVAYNANADILVPMVIYDGKLSEEVCRYFRTVLAFHTTSDGHPDLKSLHTYIQYVDSCIYWQELPYPVVVYLQPELADLYSFACWQWTTENSLMVYPIPQSVFSWLTSPCLGLMNKIHKLMLPYLMGRIFPKTNDPAKEHVLNALYQVVANGKLLGQMKSTFCKLKLITIKKAPKRKCDILQELLGGLKHFRKTPLKDIQVTGSGT